MIIVGTIIAWLTMIAPITVLLSWLLERSTAAWLPLSVLLAPFAVSGLWRALHSPDRRIRWPVMQYFGWGAVLLPLIIIGAIGTIWLPAQTVGMAALAAWPALGAAGVIAATRIGERHLAFDDARLDRPYRLIQLSDLHVGSRSAAFLHLAIKQALRHGPDAILITGDLLDSSAVRAEDLSALADASCAVYVSLGNHERYIDVDAAAAMIETLGVDLLRNRAAIHGRLQFIGIDDADDPHHVARSLPGIALSDRHYRILLYHRPDGWAYARRAGIDLMLAGHTHAGQIWPFNHVVRRRFEHLVGLFSRNDRHLYVSPGTGCWGPVMRLGTRAEMTVIDLRPIDRTDRSRSA